MTERHGEVSTKIWAAMVGLGACARLLPHPWNFTPITAIGLYAGAKSPKVRTGALVTLLALLLSDAILGFYRGMWYVYAAWLVPVLIGGFIRKRHGAGVLAAAALCSSLSFFLTTNFMVWAGGHLYPHTAAGLAACYVAGLPFYQNQVLGDAVYTLALFGGHALIAKLVQPAPQAA
jgi:hypothetical protein